MRTKREISSGVINAGDYNLAWPDGRRLRYFGSSQGQGKDEEMKGAGNSNTAMYRQYDTRLGRRWNTDPVVKDWESPYACFADNPVWFIDPDGKDSIKVFGSNNSSVTISFGTGTKVHSYNLSDYGFDKDLGTQKIDLSLKIPDAIGLDINTSLSFGFCPRSSGLSF